MTNLGIHVIDVSCEKANFIPTLIPILGQPIAMQSIQWPWCKCMWWNWRNFSFSQNANDVNTFNTSVNLKIFRIDCAERHFTTEKRRFLIWHLVLYIPFDKCELKWRRRIVTQSVGLGKNAFIGKLCSCVCSWFSMIVRTWQNLMYFEYVKHVQNPNTTTINPFPLPSDKMWFCCYEFEYSRSFILGLSVKLQAFSMIAVWFSKSCLSIYECGLCACACA